jgi:hypothetical protein
MQAKTRDEMRGEVSPFVMPGTKLPEAEIDSLREYGSNENFPRIWQYINTKHTRDDFYRPGYFSTVTRGNLRVGDMIEYTLGCGSLDVCEWQRGRCVVVENPSNKTEPVILGSLMQYPKPSPYRVDPSADRTHKPEPNPKKVA